MRIVTLAKGALAAACMVGAGLVVLAPRASAETPDVGQTIATAANAVGQTTITGSRQPSTDVDLYRICIGNPAAFGMSVAANGGDGQLFLFDVNGLGKAANDDFNAFEPGLPAGNPILATLPPGYYYYLGLSNFNVDPSSAGGSISGVP